MDPFGLVGQVLDGHFRVDRYVGEGGFSTVYRGTHVGLSEPIAVKCLKLPAALGSALVDSFVKRFRDESRIHYKLSQGNLHIARSIASGTTIAPATGALVPYTVLEWLEGRSLAEDFTDRRSRGLSGRTLREVVQIFDSAVDALAYAHAQGVVHRDMNPGNLFFAKTPSGTKLKVLDFGVAKILADSALAMGPSARTLGNVRMFAPAYAAPEQFDERVGAIGPETDVYALGLVLLEALMDRTVREGEHLGEFAARALDEANPPTPRALGIAVGDEVERVLGRAVALKPGDRPGDAGELWGMLKHAMRADSGSGRPPRADKSVSRPPPVTQRMSEPVPSRANTPVVEVSRPKADPSRSFGGTLRMENRPPRTASDALAATPFPARVAATLPLVEHTPAPAPPVAPLGLVPAPMSGPAGMPTRSRALWVVIVLGVVALVVGVLVLLSRATR